MRDGGERHAFEQVLAQQPPLVFSLEPRCQGECGSAKKTRMPVAARSDQTNFPGGRLRRERRDGPAPMSCFIVSAAKGAQLGVLHLEPRQAVAQRADRFGDVVLGKARRNVLPAVPVERGKPDAEDPLGFRPVFANGDLFGQSRIVVQRQD